MNLSSYKQELPQVPVITATDDSIRVEFDAGGVQKIAEIKGNGRNIGKQLDESRLSSPNSGYYGRPVNDAETKPKCEFKTVMTNEEIKNCQN